MSNGGSKRSSSSSSSSSKTVRASSTLTDAVTQQTSSHKHSAVTQTAQSVDGRKRRSTTTMNGILAQQGAERTALFRPGRPAQSKQTQQPYTQQSTPAAVHRVHSAPVKNPEPVCILGCCGIGKLSILWTVSSAVRAVEQHFLVFVILNVI